MGKVEVQHRLADKTREQVLEFLSSASPSGHRLNDHLLSDLRAPRAGFVAAIHASGALVGGYAQASTANEGYLLGCIAESPEDRSALLSSLLGELPSDVPVTWWTRDDDAPVADALGLVADRRLLNMCSSLPVDAASEVPVRPFRPGHDDVEWLAVNNAAFAFHGEQGGWDAATLRQRVSEPWFSADGFLVHERDGRMAAFCWTKLHPGPPLIGEIYVIAVHPDFHGLGLGRALTVAGLQHLHSVGAMTAMLYVAAENTVAIHLYERLGFTVDHADQSYVRPASPTLPRPEEHA
jgi:mycothiol synthase